MKVGLFGGSFNPIHKSHVNIVNQVLNSGEVDEVWIIPCRDHSFKKNLLPGNLRVKMIEMCFNDSRVKVSREELDYGGKSYAIETVKRLKEKNPLIEFFWIGGSDLLHEIDKWYEYSEFLSLVGFIVFEREGYPIINVSDLNLVSILSDDVTCISSSEIRWRVFEGRDFDDLVLPSVKDFILDEGLYK